MKRLLLPLCLLFVLGCPEGEPPEDQVGLVRNTGAPPTLTSELFDDDTRQLIRMSHGLAMGVTCWDYCDNQRVGCRGFTVTSADEEVISVRNAFRTSGQDTFVLVATGAGTTDVTVTTACGSKTYSAVSMD